MSWCRFASVCSNQIPHEPENDSCPDETCPGSDLYIYEGHAFICCMCALLTTQRSLEAEDFECATELEMYRHILAHVDAGHHVRKSLIKHAKEALS